MVSPPGVGCTPMVSRGRADLHMHTTASDGWPSPQGLVDYARATRLNVIAVTDHDTIEGAVRAAEYAAASSSRLQVVIGEEVTSRDGHIVGLFVERRIRDAVGRAFTEFRGKTPKDLRTAIETGTTVARRRRYRAMGLMRYAAWGLNHQRYAAVV